MRTELSKEPQSLNKLPFGLFSGLVAPFIFFVIYYLSRFSSQIGFSDFVVSSYETHQLIKVCSISVFPNLLVFFVFMKTNRLTAGKGVLAATIFYAVIIFVIKLING